ncbi:hypothetical protein ANDO2_3054 [plant metagenome]|uniref:Uncharacterized protein n=1 Tax=plant metagenome TaxID=1297885 RepID=A0A484QG31_9ZZZZ
MVLPDQGIERPRAPLTGKYQISHAGIVGDTQAARLRRRQGHGMGRNEKGEPDFGTGSARLWLLRSRPDQICRRTMRRGPPPLF